jgi:putative transposase
MGLQFPAQKYGQCFFVTTTFKEWYCFGNVEGFYHRIADSLVFYLTKYNAKLVGYVFMPNHIHLLLIIDGNKLGDFMRDFKKYITQKGVKDIKLPEGSIWMPRYDRVVIYSEAVLRIKLEYIHANPVRAGLTDEPTKWIWSSAKDYLTTEKGEIEIYKDWL